MAIQYKLSKKMPMIIVGPNTLHNILPNVSLCLPENYELVAGTNFDNINLYCELIRVTVAGNVHSVKLIMHI
jgi:hypothetical protein